MFPACELQRRKPAAAKLKAWRASVLRSRDHLLGIVCALSEKSAEAAALAELKIDEDQRRSWRREQRSVNRVAH
jgi:hypothetical protein